MTAGEIYTIAGGGSGAPHLGDGGPATSATLSEPNGLTVDAAGNVAITDFGDQWVRVVAASTGTFYGQPMTAGDIYAVAGTGSPGFSGDGHAATGGGTGRAGRGRPGPGGQPSGGRRRRRPGAGDQPLARPAPGVSPGQRWGPVPRTRPCTGQVGCFGSGALGARRNVGRLP